ncbi:MAG: GNAT family N-acetyltransferase [Proteobacteria bacterium]|nr:GNAT family N-acetyltransferase [Pseudomonadota bacterium]
MRPIRPEDAAIEQEFVRRLSPESRYFRFMAKMRKLTPEMLEHFTHIDPRREMALIVTVVQEGVETEIAVGRYAASLDSEACEFAIAVADAWQHKGIARRVMQALIRHARERGIKRMDGFVLALNTKMFGLMHTLGFESHRDPEDSTLRIFSKQLQAD